MARLERILREQRVDPPLITVITSLATACKEVAFHLREGAMAGILGCATSENVQGEIQKKLDVIANDLIRQALQTTPAVKGLASEEEERSVPVHGDGSLLVCFDPLDGSSNIDINSLVGTIFSVYPAGSGKRSLDQDFLQPGRAQVAAGYVLYGPSVMLVLTTGRGVQIFTLCPRTGEFICTVREASIPADTREFSINMSNQRFWAPPMQRYIADLLAGREGPRGKNYNMRWVAAMVADVHRILCRGGIFSYPWDRRQPEQAGKLRLMYEANPMAMIVEQAGGEAWTDRCQILDVKPEHIHQRIPVILGAANEVEYCVRYHREAD